MLTGTLNKTFKFISEKEVLESIGGSRMEYPNISSWSFLFDEIERIKPFIEKSNAIAQEVLRLLELMDAPNLKQFDISVEIPPNTAQLSSNIRQFMEPLISIQTDYDESMLDIIENIWKKILATFGPRLEEGSLFSSIVSLSAMLNHAKSILSSGNNESFSEDSSSLATFLRQMLNQDWIRSDNPQICPLVDIRSDLEAWSSMGRIYNYKIIFQLLHKFASYGTNYYPACDILLKKQSELNESISLAEQQIDIYISEIKYGIVIQTKFDYGKLTFKKIDSIKFTLGDLCIFPDDLSNRSMKAMYNAIMNTSDAIEWFKTNGEPDLNDPIANKLIYHPQVENIKHNGYTATWTFYQFKILYQKGYNYWLSLVVIHKGIAWDHIDILDAIEYRSEDCLMYLLNKNPNAIEEAGLMPKEFVDKIIELEWGKACTFALNKYDFDLETYTKWSYHTDDTHKNGIRHLFHNKWNEKYPRNVDLSNIRFEKFILTLWHLLPNDYSVESPPSIEEITAMYQEKGYICLIKGKVMDIEPVIDFDPYYIDKKLHHLGFVAKLAKGFVRGAKL